MTLEIIPFDACEPLLDWLELTKALENGHRMARAEIGDTFLYREPDTLLSRSAWISGLGIAVKSATIFPENPGKGVSSVNGGVSLFSDTDGTMEALIDFHLVTKWKTAGDSLLAALRLARPDSRNILIVGAGTVAASLIEAYAAGFPDASFTVWNRNRARAEALAKKRPGTAVADDLEAAVRAADIVASATMSRDPIILGEWLQPGQHVDLIGAFRPDMREADDEAIRRAAVFVDSRATTEDHIGEIMLPLKNGVLTREAIRADFYDIPAGLFTRASSDEITLFKNGGGAHLDLMTSRYILEKWRSR